MDVVGIDGLRGEEGLDLWVAEWDGGPACDESEEAPWEEMGSYEEGARC